MPSIHPKAHIMQRIVDMYQNDEPDYVEGENVIVIKDILYHDKIIAPVGSHAKIVIRWYGGVIFGVLTNLFMVGICLPNGHQQYGLGIWDKIESLDNPPTKTLIRTRSQIRVPKKELNNAK